jgi:hypothetical protein
MKYTITNQGEINILEVNGHNIFFAWDMSDDYVDFRNSLNTKGIDIFVDLLIQNHNTAFLIFCQP